MQINVTYEPPKSEESIKTEDTENKQGEVSVDTNSSVSQAN
jgi:hypothetical protein